MHHNEEMRVIAVGDDDQNIYEFRGSDAGYMFRLTQEPGSRFVEMTENYRSARHVVAFANEFVKTIRPQNENDTYYFYAEGGEMGWSNSSSACLYVSTARGRIASA